MASWVQLLWMKALATAALMPVFVLGSADRFGQTSKLRTCPTSTCDNCHVREVVGHVCRVLLHVEASILSRCTICEAKCGYVERDDE